MTEVHSCEDFARHRVSPPLQAGMGDDMLMADIGLVANAMTVLQYDPDLVKLVTQTLVNNSDDLDVHDLTDVPPGWFGSADNAHRIGVNTQMAHQAVEEEFGKLAESLRAYSGIINQWAEDVRGVGEDVSADMAARQAVVEQIQTALVDVRDETSGDVIGDGHYTEPPAAPPATDGSGS